MASPPSVAQWTAHVATQLPHLSRPQATVLAGWSLGMVLARSCGLTAVSAFLASLQQRKENTVRQQLREWCYEAPAKRGAQRQALAVEACFAPLLRWVLRWWHGPQLALALDATTLGDRFAVLAVSVIYRGCAIPVAWAVLPATAPGAWKAEWLRLVSVFRRGWITILVALLRHEPLPLGRLIPEPWPARPDPAHGGADHAF